MNDVFGMQVLYTETKMYEYFPNHHIDERLASDFLFLYQGVEISHGAKLKNNINLLAVDKAVKVAHNVWRVHELHYFDFLHGLHANVVRYFGNIDHFDHVELVFKQLTASLRLY
jgi:hypothetical protein